MVAIERWDEKKIWKLQQLRNVETFWDDVRELTKNVRSDHSLARWQCLAEQRYMEIAGSSNGFAMLEDGRKIKFMKGKYTNNDNLAVVIMSEDIEYGGWEPYGNLTVNLNVPTAPDCAFIDSNNMPSEIIDMLEESEKIECTYRMERSGWCEYYEYRFTEEFLNEMEELR